MYNTAFLASNINGIDDFLNGSNFNDLNVNKKELAERDKSISIFQKKRKINSLMAENSSVSHAHNHKRLKVQDNDFKKPNPV